MSRKIHDISPLISRETAVFPMDVPFERKISMDFDRGHHLGLSSIHTTLHIGAHADAPNHYNAGGVGIHERDLNRYYGECQVVTVKIPRGERIKPSDVSRVSFRAPRVLFRTLSFRDPNQWNEDFNSLSPELIHELTGAGVILIGIDTPSVDPAKDEKLLSHQAIHAADLSILEGLVLDQVQDGFYILSALPLKLKDCDASPVRAVLIEESK